MAILEQFLPNMTVFVIMS